MVPRNWHHLPVDPDPLLVYLAGGREITAALLEAAIAHRITLRERLDDFPDCGRNGECAWHEQLARRNSLDLVLLERALSRLAGPARAIVVGQVYFQPCSHCRGQIVWYTYPAARAGEWRCAGCGCAWTIDFQIVERGDACPVHGLVGAPLAAPPEAAHD